jgi:predicted nucleic acid-binding protein
VSESATRLCYDVGLPAALAFRDRVAQAADLGVLQVVGIDDRDATEGWSLMGRHADLSLSFTDATSAAVARRLAVTDVFGFDADLRAMGFVVHPSG